MRVKWKLPVVLNVFSRKNVLEELNLDLFFLKNPNLRPKLIPLTLVNKRLYIHNGRFLRFIDVTSKMIGHKMGEFSMTKTLGREFHLASEKKKKKKKRK